MEQAPWIDTVKLIRKKMRERKVSRYQIAKALAIPTTTMYRYLDTRKPKTPDYNTGRAILNLIGGL